MEEQIKEFPPLTQHQSDPVILRHLHLTKKQPQTA